MFWVVDAEACVLVVSLNRDEILQDAITDVENWKVAAGEATGQADIYLEKTRQLESQVASMVSKELYQEADSGWKEAVELGAKLQKEIADARADADTVWGELTGILGSRDYATHVEAAEAVVGSIRGLEGRLEDARAEVEALRAEGGEEARGSKKPAKRKRK